MKRSLRGRPGTTRLILLVNVGMMWACGDAAVADGGQWELRQEWAAGGADATGPLAFGEIRAVSIGPDGRAYVLDGQSNEIHMLGEGGEWIGSMGGRGDGPGEFQLPLTLAWSDSGQMWVPDLTGRYTVFDSNREVIATFPRPPSSVARVGTAGAFDQSGAFIDEMGWSSPGGDAGVRLMLVQAGGRAVDTLPLLTSPPFDLRRGARGEVAGVARPMSAAQRELERFRPRLVYAATRDGTWSAASSELRLVRRSFSGDTIQIVELDHRTAPRLTRAERSMIADVLREGGSRPADFAYGPQVIQAIYVHPDGRVFVHFGPEEDGREHVLDVLNPDGALLGTIRTPLRIDHRVAPAFSGNVVILVARDDLDVQSVIRARLVTP